MANNKALWNWENQQYYYDRIKDYIDTQDTLVKNKITKKQIGLENVENKNSADIRNEITKENVVTALGFEPVNDEVTDTKASQVNTITGDNYRVILSGSANDITETAALRKSTNIRANPETGEISPKGYGRVDITGQTVDLNDLLPTNGSPNMVRYFNRLSNGASNMQHVPVSGVPFTLDVDLVRYAGTTDFSVRQCLTPNGSVYNDYIRWHLQGEWTEWHERKYTDTTYALPIASGTLGGVKTISKVTSTSGLTACPIIEGVPYYKDTDTKYTLSSFGVTVSSDELNSLSDITGNVQVQLNGKFTKTGGNLSGNVIFDNNKGVYIKDANGTNRGAIILNGNNNYQIAAGGHEHNITIGSNATKTTALNGTVQIKTASEASVSGVRQMASGTASASTANCPLGAWYGVYK